MDILLSIIILIIIIILLIIIVLKIGIKIEISVKYSSEIKGKLNLFILNKIRVLSKDFEIDKDENNEEPSRNNKLLSKELIKKIIDDRNSFINIFKIIKRSTKLEHTNFHIKFGFNSPSTTAKLSGFLWAIGSILSANPKYHIRINPVFNEEMFNIEYDSALNISLLKPLYKILKIIRKEPTKSIVKEIIKGFRDEKNEP
ncbi:MAG: DUF2953 domain-containing protein [Methanobrevibacter sp.]